MDSSSSLVFVILLIVITSSVARELRPSYHGLDYQSSPPLGGKLPPEMKQFFRSPPNPKSALPRAMKSNDTTTTWNNNVVGADRGGHRLRHVLLVGSLVCGAVGAALLAVSAFMYFGRHKTQTQIVNSKAIVICK